MDFDSFLASPRWEILQIIAKNPSSPVEIAKKLNTTVSYISQQLKLLDAAGIVKKQRTGAVEKGKPRMLFSISKDILYLTALSKGFSGKKLLYITEHHKSILKIWMLEDASLHYPMEKIFWKLEENLQELEGIFIETSANNSRLIIISDSKKLKLRIDAFAKKLEKKIECSFISKSQVKKFSSDSLVSLHDPNHLLNRLKGGHEAGNEND